MCLCFSKLSFKSITVTLISCSIFIFGGFLFFGKLINNAVVLFESLYSFSNSLNFGSTSITCGKEVFIEEKDTSVNVILDSRLFIRCKYIYLLWVIYLVSSMHGNLYFFFMYLSQWWFFFVYCNSYDYMLYGKASTEKCPVLIYKLV